MNKRIFLIIALILTFSIIFSTVAYATNIDLIKPDYTDVVIVSEPTNNVIIYPSGVRQYFSSPSYVYQHEEYTPPVKENISNEDDNTPIDYQIATEDEPLINYDNLIKDIFALVNQARMDTELEPLTYNNELQEAADLRAKEVSQVFSHTRPNGEDFATAIKIDYIGAGENLIMADDEIADAEILMDTWMNSEGHRANIMSNDFTSIAIGVYKSDNVTYVTQLFLKMA